MSQSFILHKGDANRPTVLANAVGFLGKLPDTHSWRVEIKRYVKTKSTEQNSALWGLAYPILRDATGEDVNDWHEFMLGEHFGWIETNLFGKRKQKPARTTTTGFRGEDAPLSTVEFAAFFDFIQRRAAQHGVFIPDPDPLYRSKAA